MFNLIPGCSVIEIFMQWTPIMDGVDVTDQPLNSFALGKVAPVPVIIVSAIVGNSVCKSSKYYTSTLVGNYI